MEVIVVEDQLSLAIGKKGQNVRLATRLVGWDIDIVSEEVIKKEIAQQMGKMMASGEAVPVSALEGVTAAQADTLKDNEVNDVETLAAMSVDNLVDMLDISLDQAEKILSAAQSVVKAKDAAADVDSAEESEEPSDEAEASDESGEETTEAEPSAEDAPETEASDIEETESNAAPAEETQQ
jgi:N utilization substance protein A